MKIRRASLEDAEAILKIYSYYVENTAISFEYTSPSAEDIRSRIKNTLEKYPYLVAVENTTVVGYAYAGVFKNRPAYNHCAELTVYVENSRKKRGIGKALYHHLEDSLKRMDITNLYACVAVCGKEDGYLTDNSRRFHEHMGYEVVGRFHSCGRKFGNSYDMVWMEKICSD